MRITPTHPPSPPAVARFRADGHWPATGPAELPSTSRPALSDGTSVWTYADLNDAVTRIRLALSHSGVTPEDAVLVVAPLRNQAVAAYLAVVRHGSVAVLLDHRSGRADVETACAATRPRVALATPGDADRLGLNEFCVVLPLDGGGTELAVPAAVPVDPDAAAVVVFTSGTTSTPKGVIHTVNSLRCGVANMVDALHLDARDTLFLASPVASITGVLQLESALSVGARVVLAERFSPEHAFEQVQATGATVIGGAPVIAETVLAEADRRGLTSLPLRCIALGGAMIPPAVVESANRFGVRVVRVYGSSEVPFSTSTALDAYSSDDGVALPGVDVAIGDSGELLVSGPHQFHGYLDPAHNDESFEGDRVRTGDLAELLTDHRIRITGRLKEIVIRKGKKISLAEIDLAATGLGECVAFAVPDEQTGERLALAIRGTTTAVTYQAVRDELTAVGLAVWKLPEQIVVWSGEFPRTPSGKVIRRALADETRWMGVLYGPRLSEDSGQRI